MQAVPAASRRPAEPKRILVIHTAFPGDIVLATSFLAGLRQLTPGADIFFLTTPAGAKIIEPNPWRILPLTYDKRGAESGFGGFLRKARSLRELRPDLVFCLHRSLRSSLLAKVAGGETWGFLEGAGSVIFSHRVSRRAHAHEAEKNLALLAAWAGQPVAALSPYPQLALNPVDEQDADRLLAGLEKFAAFAPSSVWATKRWPAGSFAVVALELWRKHGLAPVVVGGPDPTDRALGRELAEAFARLAGPNAPAVRDLSGATSFGSLKAVLARARIVVANDSAPLHFAVAMGAPALGVFGPTTKELGFFPLAPAGKSGVAEVVGLSCRPCGLHGHAACPQAHFRCMLDLKPEQVLEEAEKILWR